MKKERLMSLDIIRIVAIYLVLSSHSYTLLQKPTSLGISSLFASSGVPLFVMVSGALLLSKKEKYLTFFKKRKSKILLPWVAWSVVSSIYFIQNEHSAFNTSMFISTIRTSFLSFWFLPMIIGLYFLTPPLRNLVKNSKKKDLIYLIVIWFVGISLLPFLRNTPAFPKFTDNSILRQVIRFAGYYLLGYFIFQYNVVKNKFSIGTYALVISLIWTIYKVKTSSSIDPSIFVYHSPGVILFSSSLFIFLIKISNNIEQHANTRIRKIILYLSKYSFGVYLSHLIIRDILTSNLSFYPLQSNLIITKYANSFMLFLASYVFMYLLTRNKFLKNIFT